MPRPAARRIHPYRLLTRMLWVPCTSALFGLLPASSFAGYHFTISASSTDSSVNTAAPAGGTRTLYLWLACTDEGLSAFEGDFSGTLTVLGFTPMNGVVNVGGATNLLLGVPDCPDGVPSDFLLGSLLVNDTGGTVCLSPSAENDLIAAVDCASPLPALHEDPRVTGFSSSGGAPCSVGSNDCIGGGYMQGGSGGGSIGSGS